mmetsp:Transcript_12700/g.23810  ORF Transcript_12700/g.23810 Transcript_12700/m.23810 type:complete len:126 (-) Transcript_12700:311-688(-)
MSLRVLSLTSMARRGMQQCQTGRLLVAEQPLWFWPTRGGAGTPLVETCRKYSMVIDTPKQTIVSSISESLPSLWNEFTLLIKRTFQPSIIRKRRKTGFLTRHKSVGGRRVLERRARKGRARMGGC